MGLYKKANKTPEQIVILSGGMSALNMTERISGFRSVMGDSKIDKVLTSLEIPDFGKELLSYELTHNKQINGVQMVWGVPVLSGGVDSVPALLAFMKRGGISIFFDVSKPLLKYIKENPNCATMKQDFHSMGYDGVKNMYNAILDKPYKMEILYDVKVIDQTNAEKELADL
jgi:ABC-type sugar transport system substrate-binding protein